MQIAGRECAVCHGTVSTMRSGAGCERCEVVVHQTCAPDGFCPNCRQPFLPTEQVHARSISAELAARVRPRAVSFIAAWSLLTAAIWGLRALLGLGQITPGAGAGKDIFIANGLVALMSGAIGLGFLKGHDWARRLYLWGVPILLLSNLALDDSQPSRPWWLPAGQAVLYGICVFLLTRAHVVEYFRARPPLTRT